MLEISDAATEVLHRASDAATRFNPLARIRIYRLANRIETSFAESAFEGDDVIEHDGMSLFVEPSIEGRLDVTEQHDRLVVKPT